MKIYLIYQKRWAFAKNKKIKLKYQTKNIVK